MRNEVFVTLLAIMFFVIAIGAILFTISNMGIYFSPMPDVYKPKNCSNSEIIKQWDSIFEESSSGVYVFANESNSEGGACTSYFAYKIVGDEANLITGINFPFEDPSLEMFYSVNGKFKGEYLDYLRNITIENSSSMNENILSILFDAEMVEVFAKPRQISSESEANSEFDSKFKVQTGEWSFEEILGFLGYHFNHTSETEFSEADMAGYVMPDFSYNKVTYTDITDVSFIDCVTEWESRETPCNSSNRKTIYYVSSNLCMNQSGKPANKTESCIYRGTGLEGYISDIDENIQMEIKINNTKLNHSKVYREKQEIKIYDGNKSIIEFYWNFTETPLNLKEIKIEKQDPSSSRGYLIVNGIGAYKRIRVARLLDSTDSVCVVDKEIDKISNLSSNCTGSGEEIVECSRNSSGKYDCDIIDNMFVVDGLTNSTAIEFSPKKSLCTPDWSCEDWSVCIKGNQARDCVDMNDCGYYLTKPSQIQHCTFCLSRWECTAWKPEKCSGDETQKRSCTDKNNCETNRNKPQTSQDCDYKSSLKGILIVIGIIIIIAGAYFGLITYLRKKGGEDRRVRPVVRKQRKRQRARPAKPKRRKPPERVPLTPRPEPPKSQPSKKKSSMTLEEAKKFYQRDLKG